MRIYSVFKTVKNLEYAYVECGILPNMKMSGFRKLKICALQSVHKKEVEWWTYDGIMVSQKLALS